MGLDGHVLDVGHAVSALDDDIRLGETCFHVPLAQLEMIGDIGAWLGQDERRALVFAQVGVDEGRIGFQRLLGVEEAR